MSVERLERVLWRLRKKKPNTDDFTRLELEVAIMRECGTDPTTVRNNKRALKKLGWVEFKGGSALKLTNADLEEG